MVCEFGCGDHHYAILADLLPEMLDKEVKKHQAAWVEASLLLKPDELKAALPVVYPKMNLVEGLPLPCVGKFDVRKAREEIGLRSTRRLGGLSQARSARRIVMMVAVICAGRVVVGRGVVGWRLARYLDTGASHHRCGGVWMGDCGGG
jgi:hypothetical protein